MAKKQQAPDEDAPDPQPASYGAILGPYGVMTVVPRPLGGAGGVPEPEERWTLGPGCHKQPDPSPETEADGAPDAAATAEPRERR